MSEKEFFEELFPFTPNYLSIDKFDIEVTEPLEYWDKPRTEEEGLGCECVGENTNKALFEYFMKLLKQGINLPIYIKSKNQIMDGWHRYHAYYYSGITIIPVYRNKLWRNNGFCWKNGIEGKRRLRLKTW